MAIQHGDIFFVNLPYDKFNHNSFLTLGTHVGGSHTLKMLMPI